MKAASNANECVKAIFNVSRVHIFPLSAWAYIYDVSALQV